MDKLVVLYVEDEEDDVLFMRLAFQRAGIQHPLKTVSDGKAAIAYLSGDPPFSNRAEYPLPTLILLDLNLPLVSGFDVLKWLRKQKHFEELPVVIFSSSGRPEDRELAKVLGATDYLPKPASGLDFAETARQLKERWLPPAALPD